MEKKELLAEIKDKFTSVIIQEFTANGAKIQFNAAGEVRGKYSGSHMETVDVLQKMDGTNEFVVRAIETTKNGDVIMISGKGTGKQEMGSTVVMIKGECTYMTMSPELSWLNNKRALIEGISDLKSGEEDLKIYALS